MTAIPAIGGLQPFGGMDALGFYRGVTGLEAPGAAGQAQGAGGVGGTGFTDLLKDKLGAAMEISAQGSAAATSLAAGTASDISAATVAVQKAAITEQLLGAVRNKAIEAYQDVMRMQV